MKICKIGVKKDCCSVNNGQELFMMLFTINNDITLYENVKMKLKNCDPDDEWLALGWKG